MPLIWGEDRDEACAKYQSWQLPLEFANRALNSGHAIEMSDSRVKHLNRGFSPAPPPAYCVDLRNPDLKPFKPIFGEDKMKMQAEFRETRGGSQSWINAERG
jgi:hypothetical protein